MRSTLTALVAACAVLLAACDGGATDTDGAATDPAPTPAPGSAATATEEPGDGDGPATVTEEPPADVAQETAGEVMGGEEGQRAADRAKEFLIGLVRADPEACTLLLSFSDPDRPMTQVPSDLELCRTQLPATMEATVEAQGLGEDGIAVLESMQIRGADVQGDTAVIGQDNYSPLFAEAMGESTITLHRIDDAWYVDLDAYLATD